MCTLQYCLGTEGEIAQAARKTPISLASNTLLAHTVPRDSFRWDSLQGHSLDPTTRTNTPQPNVFDTGFWYRGTCF